jgi:hypothetical protein
MEAVHLNGFVIRARPDSDAGWKLYFKHIAVELGRPDLEMRPGN